MQPVSWEIGELLAQAISGQERASRCLLDPEPFLYHVDTGAVAVSSESARFSVTFQANAYFVWLGQSATVFPTGGTPAGPTPNDMVRFKVISSDRTIARSLQSATSTLPMDGWCTLGNIAGSVGTSEYPFYWPWPFVFRPTEQLEVTFFPGPGAGLVANRRLFLTLHGVKLFPYQR